MPGLKPTADQQMEMAIRLVDGDESVLSDILRRLGPCASTVLRRAYCTEGRGLRPHDIEDILAIALRRLWKNRMRYNNCTGSLWTWFLSIALNVARDILKSSYHKARQLEASNGQETVEYWPTKIPSLAPEDKVERKKRQKELQDVREVMAALPENYKTILLTDAATRDGKASSNHLAELLDIPVNQVPMNRRRAIQRVRTELRKRGHEVP